MRFFIFFITVAFSLSACRDQNPRVGAFDHYNLSDEERDSLVVKAEDDDSDAAFRLYYYYAVHGQVEKSEQYLSKAASLGHEKAIYNLKVRNQNKKSNNSAP